MNFKQTKRTIVIYGGGHWISIPAEYIRKYGIEKGTIMTVKEENSYLTFSPEKVQE